jgi:hypothetical protein
MHEFRYVSLYCTADACSCNLIHSVTLYCTYCITLLQCTALYYITKLYGINSDCTVPHRHSCTVLCYITPHCNTLSTPHCTTSPCTTPHCTTPHCTTPHCTTPHCTTPHNTTPHCTTPHHTAPHHTALTSSPQHIHVRGPNCAIQVKGDQSRDLRVPAHICLYCNGTVAQ